MMHFKGNLVEFRPITRIWMNPYEKERRRQKNVEKTLKLITTKVELAAHFSTGRTKDYMFGNGFCIAQNKRPIFQKG